LGTNLCFSEPMNWKLRIDRIHRMKEKGEFDRVVMPLSYLGMGIGFLALCWVGIARLDGGKVHPVALVFGLFFFVLPLILTVIRYFRGHFSKRLIA
jgi:apolipoprotein N-acyltransferase